MDQTARHGMQKAIGYDFGVILTAILYTLQIQTWTSFHICSRPDVMLLGTLYDLWCISIY
jgi:hypothetical protein